MTTPGGPDGVFPNQYLSAAIEQGVIRGSGVTEKQVQPASIDLRLGPVAYRLQCSFLPTSQTVKQRLKGVVLDEFSIAGDGAILTAGTPYLVQLKERLSLPPGVRAKANPKSSTGRADVFTRVITDHGNRFDDIASAYTGGLWVEIVPLSFPVRVNENLSLNQLRLLRGRTQLTDHELANVHRSTSLLRADGEVVPPQSLRLSDGLLLGLDLRGGPTGRVGHRARTSPPLLDMTTVRQANPAEYWDPVTTVAPERIILTPRVFYLLMSHEAVTIPPGYAAEMTAYDPTSGELRSHYAGFFDPGFGGSTNLTGQLAW